MQLLLRKKVGVNWLSEKSGVSVSHIHNVLERRRALNIDTANRLSKAMPGFKLWQEVFEIAEESMTSR